MAHTNKGKNMWAILDFFFFKNRLIIQKILSFKLDGLMAKLMKEIFTGLILNLL